MSSRKRARPSRRQEHGPLPRRRLNRKPGPAPPGVPTLVIERPAGVEKMSVVLEEFVRPFMEGVDLDSEYGLQNLFMLASLAWNISLLPEAEQRGEIHEAVGRGMPDLPAEFRSEARALITAMIAHKKERFPNNR